MSADNYLVVKHDGEHFLVGMGFASDDCGPRNWDKFKTEEEVEEHIEGIAVIEYGVEWTAPAIVACGVLRNQDSTLRALLAEEE